MNYFARENTNLARIDYKNSYKIDNEIERLKEQSKSNYFYNEEHEYAVIWYGRELKTRNNADDAIVYVDVELVNLTEPTYILKEKEYDAYITIEVAINYLHKLPIGSIWKNGRSKQRFDLPVYRNIEVTANNYEICSIAKATNYEKRKQQNNLEPNKPEVFLPFVYSDYYERIYKFDRNQLIVINHNNQRYVIHPILLFITHYSYSMDIKRIIAKYPRHTVQEKLIPANAQLNRLARQQGYNDYVIIPKGMTQRDAVFLHHYKFDSEVQTKVNRLVDAIYIAKKYNTRNVRVEFWYLPTTLNLRGIRIGDAIFCTAITGISEPAGEPINLLCQPKRYINPDNENEADFTRVIPFTPPQNIEDLELDFVRDPVNNIAVQILKERLERIGELRQLNRVQLEQEVQPANAQYIPHPLAEQAGIGDLRGRAGETALARCFFEVDIAHNDDRFDKVWKHAKEYANSKGAVANWFTYERTFQTVDDYFVMSLRSFHNPAYGKELPENVLVIAITINNVNYYILEFGKVLQDGKTKEFRGIAYRADNNEDFLYSRNGLLDLLASVVDQNGLLPYDFTDRYQGKLALFLHKDNGGNWVKNGIEKVLVSKREIV